ncbi:MAG: M20 family metallopeptidase [Phycisphaerae bacterium]|nr:M20 family metallopeptidase [Phycisphaerae bacterium]MDP7287025.1 M20 family metallopeptidase [Phycisphaerae bacterium]
MLNGLTELIKRITHEATSVASEMTRMRRAIHAEPEAAFSEQSTAARAADALRAVGLDVQTGVAGTGVIATIRGAHPGKTIALRADMDALPVTETTGKSYASQHRGLAHACGHDGHVAMLVGAGVILSRLQDKLSGEVRLLFQPAEEVGAGARTMIQAGALGDPQPDAIFALHAWPGLPVGIVGSMPGSMTASNDLFTLTVTGIGGHGARPHLARSPILGVAELVERVSALTKTGDDIGLPQVVSVGSIHSGSRANVIPTEAVVEGTIRAPNPAVRDELYASIRDIARDVALRRDLQVVFDAHMYCPSVMNDPGLYEVFARTADDLFGPYGWIEMDRMSMGSEDFACYLDHVPGLLARIGTGVESGQLHNGNYDFADGALRSGAAILAGMAARASAGDSTTE